MSSREEMLADLPPILRECPEFQEMARVEGKVFDRLERHIDEVLNNVFIDSATWGLTLMEKEFKIPTDVNKPLEHRRSVLKSKKRGIGRVSVGMIKNVAESFQNGSVEVKAIKGESKILVTFNDVYGIPPNLEDIKTAIRKILPAHRVIDFEFKYLLIKDVEAMTLAEMEATPLNKFAGGV
ncbi:putative phage tail protein [Pseudobacillus sp. 179-B 2D1 NHS]|uniref:putative phage tail protein n=1 Tax=Pseudobacillus sp. 179-B 2D1 NHS TaxID=3374292 RepID=UPI00387A6359